MARTKRALIALQERFNPLQIGSSVLIVQTENGLSPEFDEFQSPTNRVQCSDGKIAPEHLSIVMKFQSPTNRVQCSDT